LSPLRLADLLDLAGRGAAAVLHGARRDPAPARSVLAEETELVPLGPPVGDRAWRGSPQREAGVSLSDRARSLRRQQNRAARLRRRAPQPTLTRSVPAAHRPLQP